MGLSKTVLLGSALVLFCVVQSEIKCLSVIPIYALHCFLSVGYGYWTPVVFWSVGAKPPLIGVLPIVTVPTLPVPVGLPPRDRTGDWLKGTERGTGTSAQMAAGGDPQILLRNLQGGPGRTGAGSAAAGGPGESALRFISGDNLRGDTRLAPHGHRPRSPSPTVRVGNVFCAFRLKGQVCGHLEPCSWWQFES